MRFMMIVKASQDSEAGAMPGEALLAAMAAYNEELMKAGMGEAEIEIRQVFELEDFQPSPAIEQHRELDHALARQGKR